jgi:hypothetical protein
VFVTTKRAKLFDDDERADTAKGPAPGFGSACRRPMVGTSIRRSSGAGRRRQQRNIATSSARDLVAAGNGRFTASRHIGRTNNVHDRDVDSNRHDEHDRAPSSSRQLGHDRAHRRAHAFDGMNAAKMDTRPRGGTRPAITLELEQRLDDTGDVLAAR